LYQYLRYGNNKYLVTDSDINLFNAAVINMENNYLPVDNISDPIILSALAIARYSAYLWKNLLDQNPNPPGMRWGVLAGDIIGGIVCAEGGIFGILYGAAAASTIVYMVLY
jgi:hypothetical protein